MLNKIKGYALVGTATVLTSAHSMAGVVEDATSGSTATADITAAGKWVLGIAVVIFGFKIVKGMFSR